MGVSRYHHLLRGAAAFAFLLLACASVATASQLDGGFREREGSKRTIGPVVLDRFYSQKQYRPDSQEPSCISKCEGCTPCKPVLVRIPPGLRLLLEYYPEAWRCKCGDKLYVP